VSGEEFSLKGPGEFVVTKQGVKATKGAAPVVRLPAIRPSAATMVQTSKTATASLRMRSAPGSRTERPGALYPVNSKIATLQPTLRWAGDPNATYAVVVTSASGKEVFREPTRPRCAFPPLVAGRATPGPIRRATRGGDARFETLPRRDRRRGQGARRAKSFPTASSSRSHCGTWEPPRMRGGLGPARVRRPDIPVAGLALIRPAAAARGRLER
jgi:hypothetical protein